MINDSLPRLSSYEVAKRLRRFNEDNNYAHLGDCHPWDEVCFMYPSIITRIGEDRTVALDRMFGPLDETEEQYKERKRIEPRITITVSAPAGQGKSAIAELIRQKLEEIDILTVLDDDNGTGVVEEQPGVVSNTLKSRLDALTSKHAVVTINTKSVIRSSTDV